MTTTSLASLIPGLADGYRQRYLARDLPCVVCGAPATRGRWGEAPDGELEELPLCDDHDVPPPWEAL